MAAPGNVLVTNDGKGGLSRAVLKHPSGASAEIYIYGAHVTSWKRADGVEQLFVSEKADFQTGRAIRGGIPVCFPQFADQGELRLKHGFARTSNNWQPAGLGSEEVDGEPETYIVLDLMQSQDTMMVWDHAFHTSIKISLGRNFLRQSMTVKNTGSETSFKFTTALHTYFKVGDVMNTQVTGLQGSTYADKVSKSESIEDRAQVNFRSETDRVYKDVSQDVEISDGNRRVLLKRPRSGGENGFPDVVVWNIWKDKVKSMADMDDEEWTKYICVESGRINSPVILQPGQEWTAQHVLVAKM